MDAALENSTASKEQGKAISPADFAAVLTELRNSGIKPSPDVINRELEKKGFAIGPKAPGESKPAEDKIVHLSDAAAFPQQETFVTRGRQYESELEQSKREIGALQQELSEYRKALPDLLQKEATLLHQLELAAGKLLSLGEPKTESTDVEAQLQEALARETSLKSQLADIESGTSESASLAQELAEQRERIATYLQREKELTAQLEEASARALLADELESELGELRATLSDFRDRETEWAELEQRELESRQLADSLSRKVSDSAQALEDGQRRQSQLEQELAGLRYQFQEASQSGTADLESKLAEASQALDEARREVEEQNSQLEQLREQAHQAESAVAGAEERETELLGRMEAAALRTSQLEEQLSTHLHAIDWSHEHAGQLHDRLLQTLDCVSRLLPETSAPIASAEAALTGSGETDIPAALAGQFQALETVAASLHGEIARAKEYQTFLKAELLKAGQDTPPSVPASGPQLQLETGALGKYLAEIIEAELHRQSIALGELTRREADLRAQLDKARPKSGKALSLETELSGQAVYRDDMTRRKTALARLLEDTIASLRAQKSAQTSAS